MGRAVFRVAPELLAEISFVLPGLVQVVGSVESEGSIGLLVEGDEIPDGCSEVLAFVRIDREKGQRTFVLEPVL